MLKNDLKVLIKSQGYSMSQVNDLLNQKHGTNFSIQNFSNKLRRESFSYNEDKEILGIIGYDIKWEKKSTQKFL